MWTEADWTISWTEAKEGRWRLTREGAFTKVYVVFTHRETGERKHTEAEVAGPLLMERPVFAKKPMTGDEAQALADEAVFGSTGALAGSAKNCPNRRRIPLSSAMRG
jgi:hypothetical protein